MKLRFRITKDKEIRFISHLEYLRTIGRAFRRARLPVAYSQGFNPHMKFSLASALGVGVVSQAEYVELELTEPVVPAKAAEAFAKALPRGIRVLDYDAADDHARALMAAAGGAGYRVTVPCAGSVEQAEAAVAQFNAAPELFFEKAAPKAKKKVKRIDVKQYIPRLAVSTAEITGEAARDAKARGETALVFTFDIRITPGGSMKAVDLLNTLREVYGLDLAVVRADIERVSLYRVGPDGTHLPLLDNKAVCR